MAETYIDAHGSAIPERPSVSLALFNEARSERLDVDINSRMTSVIVKTDVNKGYAECLIGIAPAKEEQSRGVIYGQLPEPLDLRGFARAELRINGSRAFEGRIGPMNIPTTQIVINGHWRDLYGDDWYESTDTTLDSSGNVIKGMLAAGLSSIRPATGDGWRDPLSEHAPSEFDGKSVGDTLVQITAEGDAFGNDVDWFVWDDRCLHIVSRSQPALPTYRMAIDPETMIVQRNTSDMVSRLTIEFRAVATGTATVTSGNTSVTVSHDIGVTPGISKFRYFATNNPTNDPGTPFVENITSTEFDLSVRNDPGADADYSWVIEGGPQRTSEAVNVVAESYIGRAIRRKRNVGAMTLAAAERIRDRLSVAYGTPRDTVRVRIGDGARKRLRGPRGEILAIEQARAGQWGKFGDLPMLICHSTVLDVTGQQLTMVFGDPLPTIGELLRRMEVREGRRARGIDPESGGAIT